jgi:hypothetical protein
MSRESKHPAERPIAKPGVTSRNTDTATQRTPDTDHAEDAMTGHDASVQGQQGAPARTGKGMSKGNQPRH